MKKLLLVISILVAGLVACQVDPGPTPTPFESDEALRAYFGQWTEETTPMPTQEARLQDLEERIRLLELTLTSIDQCSNHHVHPNDHKHGMSPGGYGPYGTGSDHTHPPDHTHSDYGFSP